jgi:GTP pyrophosphokinase
MQFYDVSPADFISEIIALHAGLDASAIHQALHFATQAHAGQMRRSGDDYITHPVNVAYILATLISDTTTVIAGLLHDVLEDTAVTADEMRSRFGDEVTSLVQAVTKIQKFTYQSKTTRPAQQATNYRKLLMSITNDVRVIVIKLADRLHNMRTLAFQTNEQKLRIARETLDIYAPLANRFGIATIQWELEDLCLKYLHPSEYRAIISMVDLKRTEREAYINSIIPQIKALLQQAGIQAQISGRSKHFYSIYRKRLKRQSSYEEIFDLAALRIIVDTVAQCYAVLGVLHSSFEPLEWRFRDYIAKPKPNNYQSLHLVIIGPQKRNVEIQIRTHSMHEMAEEGIAAHWRYKQQSDFTQRGYQLQLRDAEMQQRFDQQISWIRSLLKQQEDAEAGDFVESLKLNLYPEEIVVITPAGDFIKLPKGATIPDFAFAVHSQVGLSCIGGKINGRFVPLRTVLHSGDVVEVITSPRGNPSKDWLSFMQSARARQKIRAYFREKELQDAITLGEEIFQKKARKAHLKLPDEQAIRELARRFKINDLKTFYAQIGKGNLLFSDILDALQPDQPQLPLHQEPDEETLLTQERRSARGVKIQGIDNLMIRYAKCCHPVPGDAIIGYTTRGRGITVHKADCTNRGFLRLQHTEPQRIIQLQWDYPKETTHQRTTRRIKVIGSRSPQVLSRLLSKLSHRRAKPQDVRIQDAEPSCIGTFTFAVRDEHELERIIATIMNVRGVHHIERM